MNFHDLQPMALGVLLAAAAALVLLTDLFTKPSTKPNLGWLTFGLLSAVLVASFTLDLRGEVASHVWRGGAWPVFLARLFLVAGLITVLGGMDHIARKWTYRQGEFYTVLLLCLTGMVLLPGARDLVLLIVCFELMGIPLYILTAFAKTDSGPKPVEAALKLFLIGAGSTALTVFGAALLAGLAGTTDMSVLVSSTLSPLQGIGTMLLLAGLAFKIGVAPFHMWVPDTYEGAPTPVVAFLSVAPKVVGFATLVMVLWQALPRLIHVWGPVTLVLCALTLTVGNLGAIAQRNIKRLLAYSGVGQVGYVLLGLLSGREFGVAMMLFYLAAYVVTNLGVFLVAHAVAEAGDGETISSFDGLGRRSPWLAMSLLLFLLSLAGIPFVAGFWAKFFVFVAAWRAGQSEMVLVGALFATVALFYYLGVARAAYVNVSAKTEKIVVSRALAGAIIACLLAVVGLGAWPSPVVEAAMAAARSVSGIGP